VAAANPEAIAAAASLLTAAYHMLKNGTFHQDLGADFLLKRDRAASLPSSLAASRTLDTTSTAPQLPEFAAGFEFLGR